LGALPTLYIGLIEEGAKLLVPIAVLIFTRYRANPADGLLVGVAVGMGFAVLASLGYGFVTLIATGGDLSDAEPQIRFRGMLSPLNARMEVSGAGRGHGVGQCCGRQGPVIANIGPGVCRLANRPSRSSPARLATLAQNVSRMLPKLSRIQAATLVDDAIKYYC